MEIVIALAVVAVIIVLILVFNGKGDEPNVESFSVDQMNRHVTSLQSQLRQHEETPNPSDSMRAEIQKKRQQYDHAMAVWKGKIDKATLQRQEAFDSPKAMPDTKLIGTLMKQADWLEKELSTAPAELQNDPETIRIAKLRQEYIAELCKEFVIRGTEKRGTVGFLRVAENAIAFQNEGLSQELAATKAVKDDFAANGLVYHAHWE